MDSEMQLFTKGDTDGEYVEFTRPTFAERLPEEHRENEAFQGIENLSGLAETHVKTAGELAELKSAQPIVPDEYTAPQIPDGVNPDETAISDFFVLAREIGLTQESVDRIVAYDLARAQRYMTDAGKSHDEAVLAAETALKERWGSQYEPNKEMASAGFRKVLKSFDDGDEIEKSLAASGVLDNPAVMRLFRKIGSATSEDVFVRGTQSSGEDSIRRDEGGRPILDYGDTMKGDVRKT